MKLENWVYVKDLMDPFDVLEKWSFQKIHYRKGM
jgi:hypothetical protein